MKKTVILLIANLFLCQPALFALNGEFKIDKKTPSTGTLWLHVYSTGDVFLWNAASGRKYLAPAYNYNFEDTQSFGFDAPKDPNDGKNGTMPWGVMNFVLRNAQDTIYFSVNFLDEKWSTGYSQPDIHVVFDEQNHTAWFHPDNGTSETPISKGTGYNIWELYHESGQADNFSPLYLKNIINSEIASGTLSVATTTFNSGDTAYVNHNSTYTVGTGNERFDNYQSSGITYKHNNWNDLTTNEEYKMKRDVPAANHNQEAKFVSVVAVTLQAYSQNDAAVFDSVEFRDPWYLDSYSSQPNQFTTHPSPFHPTGAWNQSTGSVFLNQNTQFNDSMPIYSVRAPHAKPNMNGKTGFFQGWSYHSDSISMQQVTPGATGYDERKVVFKQPGATLTANYNYYTVGTSITLGAGTWTMGGSITVNSGVTLTISSGATLRFPEGTQLTVNGVLSANGATFTSTSGVWTGIKLYGNGSTLSNCTISYASAPLTISGVTSATISGCTINNSNFSSSQAIDVYASTPTISSCTISGGASSSNGVRFRGGSSGTLSGTTIDGCGAGNGVVIMGGSSPTLYNNTITRNYYNGI